MHMLNLILAFLAMASGQRKRHTTSTTSETPPPDPRHFFDGVDYDLHPKDVREERDGCFGQFMDCIWMTSPLTPVCAYDTWYRRYVNFFNVCGVEITNCFVRSEEERGIHTAYTSNPGWYYYHNGESYSCQYYYRRSKSRTEMDDLYFNGTYNEMMRTLNIGPERSMKTHGRDRPVTTGLVPGPLNPQMAAPNYYD